MSTDERLSFYVYCTEIKTLEELARLDVDTLPQDILPSSSLSTLRVAVLQLELQLWLREERLEDLVPQLAQHGHTSKQSLLALKSASLVKVKFVILLLMIFIVPSSPPLPL